MIASLQPHRADPAITSMDARGPPAMS